MLMKATKLDSIREDLREAEAAINELDAELTSRQRDDEEYCSFPIYQRHEADWGCCI